MINEVQIIAGRTEDIDHSVFGYFLYRHIRKDNGEVFYVGVGKKGKYNKPRCKRAYDIDNRNRFWKAIAAKTDYEVEVFLESTSGEFIREKEIEFIKLYGRRDNGTGTLVNLTDGGDGLLGMSIESKALQQATAKKNGTHEESIKRLMGMGTKKGDEGSNAVERYAYNAYTGEFLGKFKSGKECGDFLGFDFKVVSDIVIKKRSLKGIIVSNYDLGTPPDFSQFKVRRIRDLQIEVRNNETGQLKTYIGSAGATKDTGYCRSTILRKCKKGGGTAGKYFIKYK